MARRKIPLNPPLGDVQKKAEVLLTSIAHSRHMISRIAEEFNSEINLVETKHIQKTKPIQEKLAEDEKALISLMKKNKAILFDGADVVNLPPGSLIHSTGDHVSIPRNALQACKDNGFQDVIKTVESLDRDAIEKWPDFKLVIIGAARKPKEEFNYDLKLRKD